MDRTRALLDSLMGPSRDVAKKDKTGEPDFLRDDVCKFYLIGFCPHALLGKKIKETKAEFDRESMLQPCTKLHAIGLRGEFQQHKDHEKWKHRFEADLAKFLYRAVEEVEAKIAHEKRKRKELDIPDNPEQPLCDICGIKYKRVKNDINLRERDGEFAPDTHDTWDIHKGYVKLRAKCDEMQELMRQRDEEKAKKDSERERSGDKKSRAHSRSRSERKDKSRSQRQRSGSRARRSRSRGGRRGGDKDRRREPSRSRRRDTSRGGQRDGRRRGRSDSRGGRRRR